MDRRSKREKLDAMASQNVSPNEAAIAQRLLAEETIRDMGGDPEKAFDNRYGDVLIMKLTFGPNAGRWVPLWTSNHFPDDEVHRTHEALLPLPDVAGGPVLRSEEAQAPGNEEEVQGPT